MSIVLNGTTGITTPDIDSTAAPDFDGANITNIPAGNLTGALPAISGAALTGLPAVSLANATDVTVSTADPTVSTNPTSGVGHTWISKTSGKQYILTDATAGANVWKNVGDSTGDITNATYIAATGGTITTDGNFKVHTFTSSGTFTVTNTPNQAVTYLAIGAGGAGRNGSSADYRNMGGGGAGGYLTSTFSPLGGSGNAGQYTITIGGSGSPNAGGASSPSGIVKVSDQSSVVSALGGGSTGNDGGSGGGGEGRGEGTLTTTPGSGTAGQGNDGGTASINSTTAAGGGGGGGAGAVGSNAGDSIGANGGVGLSSSITGTAVIRAGGGGGGGTAGRGLGLNGGGNGGHNANGSAGTANTGSGGGGAGGSRNDGANGGSGIVILRYQFQS
tara:strand:- start:778 stop:1944 length:1167 start_codon:yes stop_codon:yes gene_type:complete